MTPFGIEFCDTQLLRRGVLASLPCKADNDAI